MTAPRVLRVARIGLTVGDLAGTRAFYEALGFRGASEEDLEPTEAAARFGVRDAKARAARLRLGEQALELVAFDPPGRPYPEPRAANDPWFQHFAIAVADMDAAYAALSAEAQQPISAGGPQLLPPSTGSVVAYKFRDPEGRPLELSYIPGSAWLDPARPRGASPFLGVDHSALAVADLDRSFAFYTGALGLTLEATLLNQGPEQDRLDGLPGVALDIAVLRPADPASPHIELLHYRTPISSTAPRPPPRPQDLAATRLVLETEDSAGLVRICSRGDVEVLARFEGRSALVRDPDGHLLQLEAAA